MHAYVWGALAMCNIWVMQMLDAIGNEAFNACWEGTVAGKPHAQASREEKETFARAKYAERKFLSATVQARALQCENEPLDTVQMVVGAARSLSTESLLDLVAWLAAGADVNSPDPRNGLTTALHAAAAADNVTAVEYLLQNNANAHMSDSNGLNAVQLATKQGASKVMQLFIAKSLH
jgi:hypothetical protein